MTTATSTSKSFKLVDWSAASDGPPAIKQFTPIRGCLVAVYSYGAGFDQGMRTLSLTEGRRLWARLVRAGWQQAK